MPNLTMKDQLIKAIHKYKKRFYQGQSIYWPADLIVQLAQEYGINEYGERCDA